MDELKEVFTSPNVDDANGEPANMVDVLDKLAFTIDKASERIAEALEHIATAVWDTVD